MHRSRPAGFMIDCQGGELSASTTFWREALALPVVDPDEGAAGRHAVFGPGGLLVDVQQVDHPSRVHLDDLEAEVSRLEAPGGRGIACARRRWWVMEAPTGHRFCVVPMRDAAGRAPANVWT